MFPYLICIWACFLILLQGENAYVFFLDLGELWGEGGGENFHKYLFFLTSFVLFYTLKEHKKWIKIVLYMSRGVASK